MIFDVSVGILGGGQLGKMLIQKANQLGIPCSFLESQKDCPAAGVTPNAFVGDIRSYDDVMAFGKKHSHITVEIENVNLEALYQLEKEGIQVHPAPAVLDIIKNKGRQKDFYQQNHIPSADYKVFGDKSELIEFCNLNSVEFPLVIKATEGGYDGKGVWVIKSKDDLTSLPQMEYLLEEKVDILKELSVICYCNGKSIDCFETVEMLFDPEANLVDFLLHPAQISEAINTEAQNIAKQVCKNFGLQGLLAVELFLTKDNIILVNEVAPRPHNSAHHTIESHSVSQYEAHLRGVLGLDFQPNKSNVNYAAMLNLLGEENHSGLATIKGTKVIQNSSGTQLHWYGKTHTKPKRKMGHITMVSSNLKDLLLTSEELKKNVKIISTNG
jgi:5-(carboxyamino)imidazole ribonucleotide synthase